MICSLQVKNIIIIIKYVDLLLLLVTMNKIISSNNWKIAYKRLFFLCWNEIV